jgi:hypothetical protein
VQREKVVVDDDSGNKKDRFLCQIFFYDEKSSN